jgi:hypothetical protein
MLRSQRFNGALGADGHEYGRLDRAMRGLENASSGAAVCVGKREQKDPRPLIIGE